MATLADDAFAKSKVLLSGLVKRSLLRALPIALLLVLWEMASRTIVSNSALFPPPSRVATAFLVWSRSGELSRDLQASAWRLLVGFLGGGIAGIAAGLATGRSRIADAILGPVIQALRPLPPVAIIPLVIVWFGIGDGAKVFSTSFAVFFPTWINTHLGASSIPLEYLRSAQLLTRSKWARILYVVLPASLPFIVAGLRNSIAVAFVMVYVNELAGASSGLGYQISISHLAYRIDRMIAALAVLGAAGAAADGAFAVFVRVACPWMKAYRR
jgi:ABC-type nitrate/sulfonate/bicarbonate transport system permease component